MALHTAGNPASGERLLTCMVLLLAASTAILLRLVPMVEVQAASQAELISVALCMAANMPGSTFTATVLSAPPHCGPLIVLTKAAASSLFICSCMSLGTQHCYFKGTDTANSIPESVLAC